MDNTQTADNLKDRALLSSHNFVSSPSPLQTQTKETNKQKDSTIMESRTPTKRNVRFLNKTITHPSETTMTQEEKATYWYTAEELDYISLQKLAIVNWLQQQHHQQYQQYQPPTRYCTRGLETMQSNKTIERVRQWKQEHKLAVLTEQWQQQYHYGVVVDDELLAERSRKFSEPAVRMATNLGSFDANIANKIYATVNTSLLLPKEQLSSNKIILPNNNNKNNNSGIFHKSRQLYGRGKRGGCVRRRGNLTLWESFGFTLLK